MLHTHAEEEGVRVGQMWAHAGWDRMNSTCPYVKILSREPSQMAGYHASAAIFPGLGIATLEFTC